MRSLPALTLIELLVVMGILALLAVPSFLGISRMRSNQALTASAEKLQYVLTQAHIYARESKNDNEWGLTVRDQSTYRFRSRTSPTDTNPNNAAEYALEQPVVFTGNFDIWFERGTGNTTPTTVTLTTPSGTSANVSVNQLGVVEVSR